MSSIQSKLKASLTEMLERELPPEVALEDLEVETYTKLMAYDSFIYTEICDVLKKCEVSARGGAGGLSKSKTSKVEIPRLSDLLCDNMTEEYVEYLKQKIPPVLYIWFLLRMCYYRKSRKISLSSAHIMTLSRAIRFAPVINVIILKQYCFKKYTYCDVISWIRTLLPAEEMDDELNKIFRQLYMFKFWSSMSVLQDTHLYTAFIGDLVFTKKVTNVEQHILQDFGEYLALVLNAEANQYEQLVRVFDFKPAKRPKKRKREEEEQALEEQLRPIGSLQADVNIFLPLVWTELPRLSEDDEDDDDEDDPEMQISMDHTHKHIAEQMEGKLAVYGLHPINSSVRKRHILEAIYKAFRFPLEEDVMFFSILCTPAWNLDNIMHHFLNFLCSEICFFNTRSEYWDGSRWKKWSRLKAFPERANIYHLTNVDMRMRTTSDSNIEYNIQHSSVNPFVTNLDNGLSLFSYFNSLEISSPASPLLTRHLSGLLLPHDIATAPCSMRIQKLLKNQFDFMVWYHRLIDVASMVSFLLYSPWKDVPYRPPLFTDSTFTGTNFESFQIQFQLKSQGLSNADKWTMLRQSLGENVLRAVRLACPRPDYKQVMDFLELQYGAMAEISWSPWNLAWKFIPVSVCRYIVQTCNAVVPGFLPVLLNVAMHTDPLMLDSETMSKIFFDGVPMQEETIAPNIDMVVDSDNGFDIENDVSFLDSLKDISVKFLNLLRAEPKIEVSIQQTSLVLETAFYSRWQTNSLSGKISRLRIFDLIQKLPTTNSFDWESVPPYLFPKLARIVLMFIYGKEKTIPPNHPLHGSILQEVFEKGPKILHSLRERFPMVALRFNNTDERVEHCRRMMTFLKQHPQQQQSVNIPKRFLYDRESLLAHMWLFTFSNFSVANYEVWASTFCYIGMPGNFLKQVYYVFGSSNSGKTLMASIFHSIYNCGETISLPDNALQFSNDLNNAILPITKNLVCFNDEFTTINPVQLCKICSEGLLSFRKMITQDYFPLHCVAKIFLMNNYQVKFESNAGIVTRLRCMRIFHQFRDTSPKRNWTNDIEQPTAPRDWSWQRIFNIYSKGIDQQKLNTGMFLLARHLFDVYQGGHNDDNIVNVKTSKEYTMHTKGVLRDLDAYLTFKFHQRDEITKFRNNLEAIEYIKKKHNIKWTDQHVDHILQRLEEENRLFEKEK